MALEIPTVEPTEVVAGNYIQWKKAENADLPIADGWVLTYAFVTKGKSFEVTCTDNGDQNHLATITVADSTDFPAGTYKWQAYLTLSDQRYPAGTGSLVVKDNFAVLDSGHDARTFWQTVLDNVQAVIEGRATKDQSSYTVNGRQLSRTPVADLLLLYNKAKIEVNGEQRAEDIANGLGNNGSIKVRF